MNLPTRQIMLGTLCAMLSALPALADGVADPAFDANNIVKFEDVSYSVDREDWVATEPLSTARVQKIEAGKVSMVDIITTPTGVYSTDAMFSPHVQYPGISVERLPDRRTANRFAYWSNGSWSSFYSRQGNSYVSITSGLNRQGRTRDFVCIGTANARIC